MSHDVAIGTARWVKSSYSDGDGGECVEVALNIAASGVVPVRDSKDPDGPILVFSANDWVHFVSALGR
ncbi:DUF397 domain-containing protein [Allostreptomyces psammosilenae]|uniref:DUF397 domain-containing protein n=1 Tax=Allostreptomyces psammosilenae TaxID=1892865 RepID=A0A852ZUH5_9ACTN|nr:DUF397 domain-containing protein [Allostreptomyces psammosilenae]NYI05217.1 hypothetical protein [Allostreptomyces psammosilenae]